LYTYSESQNSRVLTIFHGNPTRPNQFPIPAAHGHSKIMEMYDTALHIAIV
jgi:hypothetical protein